MGKYDSSLTRVQPVFNALYEKDPTGISWVKSFLRLGSRTDRSITPDAIQLNQPPLFELSADPPKSFLKWLVSNPAQLTFPNYNCSPQTREKREALIAADSTVLSEAIQSINICKKIPAKTWWRLEGVSKVDCALLANDTVVFIEGKRTEFGASKNIAWYPHRNQVLRNLDCVAEYANRHQLPNYYVMLVVEKRLTETDLARQQEIDLITDQETVNRSLPHLSSEQQTEMLTHYLGVTTWEDIVAKFGLENDVLIDRIFPA